MNINSSYHLDRETPPDLTADGAAFVRWWQSERKPSALPVRKDMRIDRIVRLMPRLTVLDAVSPDRMVFRLTGTDIDRQAGTNPTGMNVLDITEPGYRALRAQRLWNMANWPAIGVFWFRDRFFASENGLSEGVTVPVCAGPDGRSRQLMTMFSRYRASIDRGDPGSAIRQAMPAVFFYVDIGYGTPDDGTGDSLPLDTLLRA
ncbi:PAS domain-containing protein [Minwuia sp.]|uniref:PAS domain-containing protein n=1 Tax=Minwuia sp. TaxID=2493630 RepID=UPI003A93D0D1